MFSICVISFEHIYLFQDPQILVFLFLYLHLYIFYTASAQSRGFNGSVPKCCIDGGRDFQPLELAVSFACTGLHITFPRCYFYWHRVIGYIFSLSCLPFGYYKKIFDKSILQLYFSHLINR
jgi:hypothetical protein